MGTQASTFSFKALLVKKVRNIIDRWVKTPIFYIINIIIVLTFHLQVDKHLLVTLPCACVAFVSALVLNFDPPEEQGGIAMRDL